MLSHARGATAASVRLAARAHTPRYAAAATGCCASHAPLHLHGYGSPRAVTLYRAASSGGDGSDKPRAGTYSNQAQLPHLPVPPLRQTLDRYLDNVEALLSDKADAAEPPMSQARTRAAIESFAEEPHGLGHRLQSLLEARAADTAAHPNWLEQWWDLGYLDLRVSNVYVNPFLKLVSDLADGGEGEGPFDLQVSRAARLISASLTVWHMLEHERFPALREGKDPVCMSQAARMFGHARIPAQPTDKLLNYSTKPRGNPFQHWATEWVDSRHETASADGRPRHIAVLCNGHVFTLRVAAEEGTPASPASIAEGLRGIRDAAQDVAPPSHAVPSLTMADRDTWASAREALCAADSSNEEAFHAVDSALFVVILDMATPETPEDASSAMLLGTGQNRWLDKHSLIVCANGVCGMNTEHAPGDGATFLVWLHAMFDGARKLAGSISAATESGAATSVDCAWRPVEWTLDDNARTAIDGARAFAHGFGASLRVHTTRWETFGSSACKAWSMSPDAVMQMSIQLAAVRTFGECVATYEAASTWKFLHGRTETVRSLSHESNAFVRAAMALPGPSGSAAFDADAKEVLRLLREACIKHTDTMKQSKVAQGIDRHLFGLSQLAKAEGETHDLFEDPAFALSSTWRLSTSQVPSHALDLVGFSPVAVDGVGVGYLVKPDHVVFHVSSYGASEDDEGLSKKMVAHVRDALALVQWLCKAEAAAGTE